MDIGDIADRHAKRLALAGAAIFIGATGAAFYWNHGIWPVLFIGLSAYGAFRFSVYFLLIGRDGVKESGNPLPPVENIDESPEETADYAEPEPRENGRFMQYANRYLEIPTTVKHEHLDMVREAKRRGDLPNVNTSRLNSIGISRFAAPPNASTVIEFLRRAGAIDETGKWTAEGDRMFSPPTPINGRMHNVAV